MINPSSADDNLPFYRNCHCTLKCCTFSKNKIEERMMEIGELKTGLVFLFFRLELVCSFPGGDIAIR